MHIYNKYNIIFNHLKKIVQYTRYYKKFEKYLRDDGMNQNKPKTINKLGQPK